jgi:hypothetical protein
LIGIVLTLAQWIKVLSLFFIDAVEFYRGYSADGTQVKGKYAPMFEEEYSKAAAMAKYRTLFKEVDLDADASEVHGYRSRPIGHCRSDDAFGNGSGLKRMEDIAVGTNTYNQVAISGTYPSLLRMPGTPHDRNKMGHVLLTNGG